MVNEKLFKEQASKSKMSEEGFFLNKNWMAALQNFVNSVEPRIKFWVKNAFTHTTVGGSATENVSAKCDESRRCFVQMKTLGNSPVSLLTAKCELGQVVLTFSGDPSNDHVVEIVII